MSYANNCEAYTTGSVTAANSDDNSAGTAFEQVIDGGTPSNISYSSSAARYGAAGIRMVIATSQTTTRIRISNGSAVTGRFAIYAAVKFSAVPTARDTVLHIRNASTNVGHLAVESDGKLMLTNTSNSAITASKPSVAISSGVWYGLCMTATKGTSTSDGTLGFRWYDLSDNSTLHTYEASTFNVGTSDLTLGCYGRHTTSNEGITLDFDDLRGEPTASGYLAPPSGGVSVNVSAPTVNTGTSLAPVWPKMPGASPPGSTWE